MSKKTRREFLKDAAKVSLIAATGISASTLDIKFDHKDNIRIGKQKTASVGMAEANATCGFGAGCAGGGGQCGFGAGCAGN